MEEDRKTQEETTAPQNRRKMTVRQDAPQMSHIVGNNMRQQRNVFGNTPNMGIGMDQSRRGVCNCLSSHSISRGCF